EELVIVDGEEPEKPAEEEVSFEVEELSEDDEEAAVMTPEQLAAKREQEEKERAERRKKVSELLNSAKHDCALLKFATALEYLEEAEELDGENGDLYAIKLEAYTRGFTDYSQVTTAAEVAADVAKYTSEEKKSQMLDKASKSLEENIADLRAKVVSLNKENEEKKAERAVKFKKDRNTALIAFAVAFAALALFGALTGYFATLIYTVITNKFIILTCVFGGLSFVALIALAFCARYLNITSRRVRLNTRNTSTQLGRDLLAEQAKLKAFIAVYSALKGKNDIS
ncbi:MAG: hypothetical protein K2K39_02445, partial [Clostridia bacterium]|nr:hypothetical protein [Clostridia bacterium]